MAVATDIWPSLRTFGRNFDQNVVYNTEIRIYGHMSVKLAFITQATGVIKEELEYDVSLSLCLSIFSL
jgi:hypothetical protein